MDREVLIKYSIKPVIYMAPSIGLSIYFTITSSDLFWYITVIIAFIFIQMLKVDKTVICKFHDNIIYFPTIGRQLRVNEIEKVVFYKSRVTFFYVIKIYSNAYENDILKLKVPNRESVFLMKNLFNSINVNECIVEMKI